MNCSICEKEKNKNQFYNGHSECITCTRIAHRALDIEKHEKYCPRCKDIKQRDRFSKNINAYDGLAAWCKDCHHKHEKKRVRTNSYGGDKRSAFERILQKLK